MGNGERLSLDQANAVAAYLSREIVPAGSAPIKLVRIRHSAAVGSADFYHEELAQHANLPLLEALDTGVFGFFLSRGCNDGAKLVYNASDNRVVVHDITAGLTVVTDDGTVIQKPKLTSPNYKIERQHYIQQLSACRRVTCQLLVAAVNLLNENPELWWTLDKDPKEATKFQS